MLNGYTAEDARAALQFIPPDLPRDEWVRALMAAHAAGIPADEVEQWSAAADSYKASDFRSVWKSIKPGKVGAGTLRHMAAGHGWRMNGDRTAPSPKQATRKPPVPPRKPAPGMSPADVWERSEAATFQHPCPASLGVAGDVPLRGLRVVTASDPLRIAGESMAGSLVVPVTRPDGTVSSLQFITVGDTAARLKVAGKPAKLNLPGASMEGWHTVGEMVPGGVVHIVEGLSTGWATWQATGHPAVVCFGWGRVAKVAAELRARDATARLVLVPDVGKESGAAKIALECGCLVAAMPEGWPQNSDVSDLAQREGLDVLELLLENASEPPRPEPRYKLLSGADLRDLPPLVWRVRGVLPAVGLAALFGPSASGKSFLAQDLAAAIAEGQSWFDCRVDAAPVVYAALEGEAGFKLRAQAWEVHRGRNLPDCLRMMMQPFKLTEPKDVQDLAAVVPAGAVVFIDTLNRAAPTADENSSRDMGEILEAAKRLQRLTGGLVVLVHHTGKDAARGLRGHSSLFAAMDACIEVLRDGERREWKVAKSKDGADGDAHPFKLHIEALGFDECGDPVTSCTVRVDTTAQDVQRVKLPQGGNQRLVYEEWHLLWRHDVEVTGISD